VQRSFRTCQGLRPRGVETDTRIAHPYVLPSASLTASAPWIGFLSRLNGWPARSPADASPSSRGCQCTARSRCGSLVLHRGGLPPPTPAVLPAHKYQILPPLQLHAALRSALLLRELTVIGPRCHANAASLAKSAPSNCLGAVSRHACSREVQPRTARQIGPLPLGPAQFPLVPLCGRIEPVDIVGHDVDLRRVATERKPGETRADRRSRHAAPRRYELLPRVCSPPRHTRTPLCESWLALPAP
jgi:hypothetical protein